MGLNNHLNFPYKIDKAKLSKKLKNNDKFKFIKNYYLDKLTMMSIINNEEISDIVINFMIDATRNIYNSRKVITKEY